MLAKMPFLFKKMLVHLKLLWSITNTNCHIFFTTFCMVWRFDKGSAKGMWWWLFFLRYSIIILLKHFCQVFNYIYIYNILSAIFIKHFCGIFSWCEGWTKERVGKVVRGVEAVFLFSFSYCWIRCWIIFLLSRLDGRETR